MVKSHPTRQTATVILFIFYAAELLRCLFWSIRSGVSSSAFFTASSAFSSALSVRKKVY